jgi:hypothetical protein
METKRIKCPVCGQFSFERMNNFEVFEVCGWENDGVQYGNPDYDGGANELSLNQFREQWQEAGCLRTAAAPSDYVPNEAVDWDNLGK